MSSNLIAVDEKEYLETIQRHNSLLELFMAFLLSQPDQTIRIPNILFNPNEYEMERITDPVNLDLIYRVRKRCQLLKE